MARKNPRRNISRIVSHGPNAMKYCGWEVRIQRRGEKTAKFFSDSLHDGNRNALNAAKKFRDELVAESRKFTVKERALTPSIRNQSGIVGVRLHQQKDHRGDFEYQYWYWIAQWVDGRGQRKTRSFSVHQHGDEEAYRMACAARRKGVAQAKR